MPRFGPGATYVFPSRTATRRHFNAIVAACAPRLVKRGLLTAKPIACGRQGCVFRSAPGRVVKLTNDPGEALFAQYLADNRGRLPIFLPVVYGVWRIGRCAENAGPAAQRAHVHPDYVIQREEIATVPWGVTGEFLDTVAMLKGLARAGHRRTYSRAAIPARLRDRYDVSPATVSALLDFYDWAESVDLDMIDLHSDNFGVRWETHLFNPPDPIPVIRDLGFTTSTAPTREPALAGRRGMRLHGLTPMPI